MKAKSTNELDQILSRTSIDGINDYLSDNEKYMSEGDKAFYYYYKDVLAEKNIKLKDVYIAVDRSESYCGQIIRKEKHTDNRDLMLSLCIAGHFLLDEINRALKLYGMNPLYAKDKRDACIIVAINNRKYDLHEIDRLLDDRGFTKLLYKA